MTSAEHPDRERPDARLDPGTRHGDVRSDAQAHDDAYRLAALLGQLGRLLDPVAPHHPGAFRVDADPPEPLPPTGPPWALPGEAPVSAGWAEAPPHPSRQPSGPPLPPASVPWTEPAAAVSPAAAPAVSGRPGRSPARPATAPARTTVPRLVRPEPPAPPAPPETPAESVIARARARSEVSAGDTHPAVHERPAPPETPVTAVRGAAPPPLADYPAPPRSHQPAAWHPAARRQPVVGSARPGRRPEPFTPMPPPDALVEAEPSTDRRAPPDAAPDTPARPVPGRTPTRSARLAAGTPAPPDSRPDPPAHADSPPPRAMLVEFRDADPPAPAAVGRASASRRGDTTGARPAAAAGPADAEPILGTRSRRPDPGAPAATDDAASIAAGAPSEPEDWADDLEFDDLDTDAAPGGDAVHDPRLSLRLRRGAGADRRTSALGIGSATRVGGSAPDGVRADRLEEELRRRFLDRSPRRSP